MNKNASALGKLARGKPKHFSKEDIEKFTLRLAKARKKRWPKK